MAREVLIHPEGIAVGAQAGKRRVLRACVRFRFEGPDHVQAPDRQSSRAEATPFLDWLQRLVEEGHSAIEVDVSELDWLSPMAVRRMSTALLEARHRNCSVTLCASKRAESVLQAVGIADLATIKVVGERQG